MKNFYDVANRLKFFREELGLSQKEAAEKAGIEQKDISRMETAVSKYLVDEYIQFLYKNGLDMNWLFTGHHKFSINMPYKEPPEQSSLVTEFKNSTLKKEEQDIPLYDMEAAASIVQLFQDRNANVIDRIHIPNLPSSDGALFVTGDSMYPLIKSGDIVIYKQVANELDSIIWGNIYLIAAEIGGVNTTMVKYIKKSARGPNHIQLVSYNEHHQPIDLKIEKLKGLAKVNASIRYNTMQ